MKVARTVLNGGDEETYRKVTRLVPTQRECDIFFSTRGVVNASAAALRAEPLRYRGLFPLGRVTRIAASDNFAPLCAMGMPHYA